jgi:hypothetical protein
MKSLIIRNVLTSSVFVICIISFVLGYFLKGFIAKDRTERLTTQEIVENKGVDTLFTLGTNQVVITKDKIVVNPGFEEKGAKQVDIEPNIYPKMFASECERIHVEDFREGVSSDKKLIQISCQIFSRESLTNSYSVIIDTDIAQVVDERFPSNSRGSAVYLNNSCISCAFQIPEFKEYDLAQHKFILANNKHRREFEELLESFEARGEESCVIEGKTMTINEATKEAGKDDKCSDLIMGSSAPEPAPQSFITIGQYRKIIENIRRVINGNNVSIFEV